MLRVCLPAFVSRIPSARIRFVIGGWPKGGLAVEGAAAAAAAAVEDVGVDPIIEDCNAVASCGICENYGRSPHAGEHEWVGR